MSYEDTQTNRESTLAKHSVRTLYGRSYFVASELIERTSNGVLREQKAFNQVFDLSVITRDSDAPGLKHTCSQCDATRTMTKPVLFTNSKITTSDKRVR